jgi:hypothetical protein
VLEELNVPSSSLPITSSDFDTEPPPTSSSSGGYLTTAEEQNGEDKTMQFWSTGLPPPSLLPPTSAILQPQMDDEDTDNTSHPTPDSDGLTFERDPQDQQFVSGTWSDYMNSDMSFPDDLAMCFDDFNQLFSDPMMSMVNTNEDTPPLPLPSSDPVIQNGIADFDLPNSGSR